MKLGLGKIIPIAGAGIAALAVMSFAPRIPVVGAMGPMILGLILLIGGAIISGKGGILKVLGTGTALAGVMMIAQPLLGTVLGTNRALQ